MMKKISISVSPEILKEVESRVSDESRSYTIERDLSRLYEMYRLARIQMRDTFTADELCVFIDVGNGTRWDVSTVRHIHFAIEDAFLYEHFDQKWEVNKEELINKVLSLSLLEKMAIFDFVERFWALQDLSVDIREIAPDLFKK
jgi:hypothetical protein